MKLSAEDNLQKPAEYGHSDDTDDTQCDLYMQRPCRGKGGAMDHFNDRSNSCNISSRLKRIASTS